jgi:hypothetical protein
MCDVHDKPGAHPLLEEVSVVAGARAEEGSAKIRSGEEGKPHVFFTW